MIKKKQNMKKAFITAAMIMMKTGMTAKKNVIKEMESLANDKSVERVKANRYLDGDNANPTTYCYCTVLRVDKKHFSKIKKVEEAFDMDAADGYRFVYQGKNQPIERYNVSYGPNLEYNILFCSNPKHYYWLLFVNDKDNPDKRFVYAMVWYDEGDAMRCLLYRIYGNKPPKPTDSWESLKKLSSLKKLKNIDVSSTTTIVDGNEVRVITSGNGANMNIDTDIENISTDSDFLIAIKHNEQKALQTGIAVKLVQLCKKHAKLLSNNERSACQSGVTDMKNAIRKTNYDPFISGMLDEAFSILSKK
mgnify:CR=1 FL=1